MLLLALKYLRLGFSVIPLKASGKEPLIDWKIYQKRRASESEVREWFAKCPQTNLGIVTGAISNIAVIDLDGADGIHSAKTLELQSPVVSVTGNGRHLWYQYPKDSNVNNAVKMYPGLDIRAEGGYVVAPPSIHENGIRYRWLGRGVSSVDSMPPFPLHLFAGIVGKEKQNAISSDSFKPKEEGWIAKALEDMKNGNRDQTIFTVLSRLRRDGYSQAEARLFIQGPAERVGALDILEKKLEHVWKRYEPKQDIRNDHNGSDSSLVIHRPSNPYSIAKFRQHNDASASTDGQLSTGYTKLDGLLEKGLKSSRLFTLAARTGVGKTNFILGISRNLCLAGKKVLLFSTEMPYEEIWSRFIATLPEPERFTGMQFYVCDSFAPNLQKVEEAINEIRPDLFVFDHINHVSEDVRPLGEFMQGLNLIRRKFDVAGIVTAQLNRAADWVDLKTGKKVPPRMSMIKGSGTIEQASSRVLLLAEKRVTPEYTEIVGNLDKNDNGAKGLIHFGLYRNPWRIEELS